MADQGQLPQSIIDELGLQDFPKDKQEKILIKMTEVVLQRIFVETMDKLSQGDQEEYLKLVEQNATPEQLEKFLEGKIANYDGMIKKIVDDFKEEMKKEAFV